MTMIANFGDTTPAQAARVSLDALRRRSGFTPGAAPYIVALNPPPGAAMTWAQQIVDCLKAHDIRVASYVPDIVTWQALQLMEEDHYFHLVAATREEEALGIAAGVYAARKRSAVFMQSSGFGNCINALGSLCIPYRIPFPMFITLRGELGEFNIAQVSVGRALVPILDSLGIQHFAPHTEAEVEPVVDGAIRLCYSSRVPVAVLLTTMLTGGKNG